jgi:hypothetical protein
MSEESYNYEPVEPEAKKIVDLFRLVGNSHVTGNDMSEAMQFIFRIADQVKGQTEEIDELKAKLSK